MATTTTNADGRARKSLAEQIDRLDAILDGLSDALQGAVADAVKEAVGQAVQEAVRAVLTEVLSNRDLQEQLQQAAQPAPAPAQEPACPTSWLGRAWGSVTGRLGEACHAVREASVRAGRRVWGGVLLGVGVAAGTAYLARERIAAAAAQVFGWCRGLAEEAGAALSWLLLAVTVCGI
jgi:hypothetical protein